MKLLQPMLIGLAASPLVAGAAPALAQSQAEFYELRNELRKLRDEVAALKPAQGTPAKPTEASGWGDRIKPLEIKAKGSVVMGGIVGGFRLPGSETSISAST